MKGHWKVYNVYMSIIGNSQNEDCVCHFSIFDSEEMRNYVSFFMDQLWNHQTSYSSMVKWGNFLVQVRNYEVMDFWMKSVEREEMVVASLLYLANNFE